MNIQPVKPCSYHRHYSNPDCQGSLMQQSDNWPTCDKPVPLPEGLEYHAVYVDRMQQWDWDKFDRLAKTHLTHGLDSTPDELIVFAEKYFEQDVVAVRTVYYFNDATGIDYPMIEILSKKDNDICRTITG